MILAAVLILHQIATVAVDTEMEHVILPGKYIKDTIGPGPLNITFESDMPTTIFISEFTT